MEHWTPIRAITSGAVAGAVGTLAMDLLWYRRFLEDGGEGSFLDWELASPEDYEAAGAPAKLGRRMVEGLLGASLPATSAGAMTTGVHWSTGMGWGIVHGIASGSTPKSRITHGAATGLVAWLGSYAVLAPADLYEPIWEYQPKTLWKDLTAHMVFGVATGAVFAALRQFRR